MACTRVSFPAFLILTLTLTLAPAGPARADPEATPATLTAAEAETLLAAADAIRFPRQSFETEISVTRFRDGEEDGVHRYRVLSRGNGNTVVLTEEPAADRGQSLLMRGRDLWLFMPAVSQPIPVCLSQRLTGEVANGDLARARFAGDYLIAYLRADTFEGSRVHVLDLTADGGGVTYDRVHYWIEADSHRPRYAQVYAPSGRLLKTLRFEAFRELAGALRPTRLVIDDAQQKGHRSVLDYDSMTVRELPDHRFTGDYLRSLP